MSMRNVLLCAALACLVAACGNQGATGLACAPSAVSAYGNPADPTDIPFDSSVPQDQQGTMQQDLQNLAQLNLVPQGNDTCTLGISDLSAPSLSAWLKTRVDLIVGEQFNWQGSVSSSPLPGNASPNVFSSTITKAGVSDDNIVTVMMNLGAYLYLNGKASGALESLQIGYNNFPITTPRVGIVQIGVGLFTANLIPGTAVNGIANSLLRLAVLFHEARHDDANGMNAGFPHAMCQSGTYAGHNACEQNLNGPYAVQATLVGDMYASACIGCSQTELDGMRMLLLDYQSRLLPGASYNDPRPEGYNL